MVMHGASAGRGRVAIVTLPVSLVGRPLVEVLPAAQVAVEGAVVADNVCKDRGTTVGRQVGQSVGR